MGRNGKDEDNNSNGRWLQGREDDVEDGEVAKREEVVGGGRIR